MLLVAASAVYGILCGWLFRRFTNHAELRRTVDRMIAHVISFRLFADEPRVIFRAQRDLLRENLRLLKLLALPLLISVTLLRAAWTPLERYAGEVPVQIGKSAVLTLPLGRDLPESTAFQPETPPVRAPRVNQVSWRVRVLRESPLVTEANRPWGLPWMFWFGFFSAIAAAAVQFRFSKLSYR